jgi:zinc protease
VGAASGQENFVRSAEIVLQIVQPRAGDVAGGIAAALIEARRVEIHGFTDDELGRAKAALQSMAEREATEAPKRFSADIASELLRHHRQGEAMMGRKAELALLDELLPLITPQEVRDVFKEARSKNRVVLITAPEGEAIPNEEQLVRMFDHIAKLDLPVWQDSFKSEPLMDKLPEPGTKISSREIPEVGVTEWMLSNGARVQLKPTNFAEDIILVKALGNGGSSLAKDDNYWSARFSAVLATLGGFGALDFISLQKRLAGSTAGLSVNVEELTQSVSANASSKDIEEMFQLMHLAFTAPRKDAESFASWKARSTDAVKNRLASPAAEFVDQFNDAMSSGHLRRKPLSAERLDKLDLDNGLAFYKRLFGHADGFTFVIVGSFDIAEIEPLVLRYIGSLPKGKAESWRDVGVKRPKGVKKVQVKKGVEPKAQVRLAFHGPAKWSLRASHNLESLADALTIVLREKLREKLGDTYDVAVSPSFDHFPKDRYLLEIAFDCDPAKADALIKATLAEIKTIRRKGIDADTLTKIKESQRRGRETTLRSNRYWLNQLAAYAYYGIDPKRVHDYDKFINEMDIKSIAKAAHAYLNTRRYIRGVLRPE